MINRGKFFPSARASVFQGRMDQAQVDGVNAILDGWEASYPAGYPNWIAYILATAFHETNQTMQPVREAYWESEAWRKANLRYYPFYGRGLVQLTWQPNYRSMSAIVGKDLVADPDLALQPDVAVKILLYGMVMGSFTGAKLSDYIDAGHGDFVNARRIINGTDRAGQIASYAKQFLLALDA